jgi:3-methyladenine DNA glycosylase/8-oxoguanine DNA glycosylase
VLRRKEALGNEVVDLEIRCAKGQLQTVILSPAEGEGSPALHDTRPDGGGPSPSTRLRMTDELQRRVTRMFQLHLDLDDFHRLTRSSPAHAWVEPAGFGRLLCGSTLWEDAVKIIATTNTMWSQTVRMVELLVAKCGREGAFPTQADVLRFSPEELQRDCRLGYRAKSIHALASVDLELPNEGTTEERFKHFLKLPGIGPYGAAHLLAMDGRHDFIAVDTEFRRFVRETYHGGRKVSDAAMLRRYAKWGRWKYLAFWSELWGSR